jgi:putative transposase
MKLEFHVQIMNDDPRIHNRRTIRLPDYDYTQAGAYFVTAVTRGRETFFGEIANGSMKTNAWGEIARREWFKSSELRSYVELHKDKFVVLPNHVHGIIWINDDHMEAGNLVGVEHRSAHGYNRGF